MGEGLPDLGPQKNSITVLDLVFPDSGRKTES